MEAAQRIELAVAQHSGVWAVCVSGGKDSIALAHVAHATGWRGPMFHFRHPETPARNTLLCHLIAERCGADLHVADVPGAFDVFEKAGFFVHATTDEQRVARNEMLRGYKEGAADAAERNGYVGQFWGLRAEESRERAITLAKKGWLYLVADRATLTACPLGQWTARDVWAYLITHDLPWLEIYDRSADRERQRSEVTWLAAEGIWRYGQGQAIRRADPALWSELTARFPGLATWG